MLCVRSSFPCNACSLSVWRTVAKRNKQIVSYKIYGFPVWLGFFLFLWLFLLFVCAIHSNSLQFTLKTRNWFLFRTNLMFRVFRSKFHCKHIAWWWVASEPDTMANEQWEFHIYIRRIEASAHDIIRWDYTNYGCLHIHSFRYRKCISVIVAIFDLHSNQLVYFPIFQCDNNTMIDWHTCLYFVATPLCRQVHRPSIDAHTTYSIMCLTIYLSYEIQ